MPGTRTSILSLLLWAAPLAAQPNYFPLEAGNEWRYRPSRGEGLWKLKVERMESSGGREYALLAGFSDSLLWLRNEGGSRLWRLDPKTKKESLWVDLTRPVAEQWATDMDECTRAAMVTGPGRVRYLPGSCRDAGVATDEFADGVGLRRRSVITFAGPVQYTLVYARVGGKEVAISTLNLNVETDQQVYVPGTPEIRVTLTLTNSGDQPAELEFPSGQTYDLVIRDKSGAEVYRWSRGRMFAMVIRNERVDSGQKSWTETIQPELQAGRYKLEAVLATTSDPRPEASVPLVIAARLP